MSANGAAFTDSHHVQNPVWTQIDEHTLKHLHPSSRPNIPALAHAFANSSARGLPDIATAPNVAKCFALLCKAKGVKHALELGTLGGYTSLWLTTENPDLHVTTIEIDPKHAAIARENLRYGGIEDDRVDIRLGPGVEVLPKLVEEIKRGDKDRLGFVYIDADKANNWHYLDLAVAVCEPGAVIFVDNIVRGGALVDPAKQGEVGVLGAKKVVENVGKDPRVDAMVLQFVGEKGYDGIIMVVVR